MLVLATNTPTTVSRHSDFYREAWAAYAALAHGHILDFIRLGPTYIGSLVLRAPFAMIPTGWGGGVPAVFFASALPCMIALGVFCAWLAAKSRRDGAKLAIPVLLTVYALFTVIVLNDLWEGHPEEILGGVLCVVAVMLAVDARPGLAGFLVGLAVVNKSWALVAVPVAMAAVPSNRRRGVVSFLLTAGVVLVPVWALRLHSVSLGAAGAQIGTIFQPPQLLWWFGAHSWIAQEARPAIVLASVACTGGWLLRRKHSGAAAGGRQDALLLLALVLLLRAALDPWNNLYYHLPFLFAILAYEVRSARTPLLTLLFTTVILIDVPIWVLLNPPAPSLAAGLYAAAVLPIIGWLVARLCLPPRILHRPLAGLRRLSVAAGTAASTARASAPTD